MWLVLVLAVCLMTYRARWRRWLLKALFGEGPDVVVFVEGGHGSDGERSLGVGIESVEEIVAVRWFCA
jgi:hypothetical protein